MTVITHPGTIIVSIITIIIISSSSRSAVQIRRRNYQSSAQDDPVQQVTTDLMRNINRRSRTIVPRIYTALCFTANESRCAGSSWYFSPPSINSQSPHPLRINHTESKSLDRVCIPCSAVKRKENKVNLYSAL